MRILRNGTLRGNTIWCEPNPNSDDDGNGIPDADGGCSGNLTMYEEFGIPHHNLVEGNYFPAGLFWFSLKFNGNDTGNIRIVGNTFGIPKSGAQPGRRLGREGDQCVVRQHPHERSESPARKNRPHVTSVDE